MTIAKLDTSGDDNQPKNPTKVPDPMTNVNKETFESSSPWYDNAIVDTDYHPTDSLLTEIQGSPLSCTYYPVLLGKDESLRSYSKTSLAIYQQYNKIERFELRVTEALPLQDNQEEGTGEFTVTGTALLYPNGFFIPNMGDVFIADVNDGRSGIFALTKEPVRQTIRRDTVYELTFTLHSLIIDSKEDYETLENRVQSTYIYHKDYLLNGVNPFLTSTQTENRVQLAKQLDYLGKSYLRKFYNKQTRTLTIGDKDVNGKNGEWSYYYDGMLVNFVKRVIDGVDLVIIPITGNNLPHDYDRQTIWYQLLNRIQDKPLDMVSEVTFKDCNVFTSESILGGIHYSPFDRFCTPSKDVMGNEVSIEEMYNQMGINNHPGHYGYMGSHYEDPGVPLTDLLAPSEAPQSSTKEPLSYSTYVLSPGWYSDDTDAYSLLESMLDDYLKGEKTNLDKLLILIKDSSSWSNATQLYHVPLVLMLGKMVLAQGM